MAKKLNLLSGYSRSGSRSSHTGTGLSSYSSHHTQGVRKSKVTGLSGVSPSPRRGSGGSVVKRVRKSSWVK